MKLLSIMAIAMFSGIAGASCLEGRTQAFWETDPHNSDQQILVVRTCKNGSYMTDAEQAAYVRNPKNTCQEGRTQAFWETDPRNSDQQILVVRTCKNGSYMTDAERAAYVYNPKNTCKEGARRLFWEPDQYGDKHVATHYVCKNGKYVKVKF